MKVPWTLFWVTEQTRPYRKIYYFQFQRAITRKKTQSRVTVLAFCKSSHVALHLCKVSWKYLKRFLSYRADTVLWQRFFLWQEIFFLWQTDGRGKTLSPNPTRGDINMFSNNYLLKSIQDFNFWKLRYQKCINIILGPEQNKPRHV